jgi:hypothetical protein
MTTGCAPLNTALLNPNEFRFYIHRAPYLNFFVQTVELPTITLNPVETENPFTTIPYPGDHIAWEELRVEFLVDEDLQGYRELYSWIRGLGFPESFEEYQEAVVNMRYNNRNEAVFSDVSVFTNTGSRNVNIEYHFVDAMPISVTAPRLSSANPDIPVVTSTATFAYQLFDVHPANSS